MMESSLLVIKLIEDKKNKLLNGESGTRRLDTLKSVREKLNSVEKGVSYDTTFSDVEREFLLNNPMLSNSSKRRLNILLSSNIKRFNKDELAMIIKIMLKEMKLDDEIEKWEKEKDKYEKLEEAIRQGNYLDNYLQIMEFIRQNVLDKSISLHQYLDIMKNMVRDTYHHENAKNEDVTHENSEDISLELRQTFSQKVNGISYDFDKLSKKNREILKKYGNIKFIEYAIDEFKRLGLPLSVFESNEDNITEILIESTLECLDRISVFIRKNGISEEHIRLFLISLLTMPEVFLPEGRCFKAIRLESTAKAGGRKRQIMVGKNLSFLENVKLYEELTMNKIHYSTFRNGQVPAIFWTTKNQTLRKNMSILKSYGIVGMPESFTSLIGVNTEYLMDKYIELGPEFYQYIKSYGSSSLSKYLYGGLVFYKLKRAIFNNDVSYRGNKMGIALSFMRKNSYDGISYDSKEKKIIQKNLSDFDDDTFDYKMRYVEYPDDSYFLLDREEFLLAELIKKKSSNSSFTDYDKYESEELISLLDRNYKYDNYTYAFNFFDEKRKRYIFISRNKVIRNIALLKEEGQFDNSMNREEMISKFKAVMLTNSLLSLEEYYKMEDVIRKLYMRKEANVRRGVL